jgi:EpsI family protein
MKNSKFNTQNSKFIIVIFVLLLATGLNHYFSNPEISLPRKSLTEFPTVLGDWSAISDERIEDRSMRILQVDDYFIRNYRSSEGEVIGLYIGYFKSQKEGKGIHSPRQCLPGAGWVPVSTEVYRMAGPGHNPETVPVNKFVMGKGLDRQLYLFWYHGRGRIYASEYWNKIYLIWDGLTRKRTDGALVRVNNFVVGDAERALKTQTEFIQLFFPLLKEYIPD